MIKFYKSENLWYLQDQVQPAGMAFAVFHNNNTEIEIKSVNDGGTVIIPKTPIIEFTDALGTPYTIDNFFENVGGFFQGTAGTNNNGTQQFELVSVNGKMAGTAFGDQIINTSRVPTFAEVWSQGLPLFRFQTTINNTGYWKVVPDVNDANYFDGVCEFGTGTNAAGGVFIRSTKKNRYLPGHLSYFGYTASWHGLEQSNGNFEALIGGFISGSVTQGRQNEIKDAICFGIVRTNGTFHRVLRVYKNYTLVLDKTLTCTLDCNVLNIFEHLVGYYGIHPSILYRFNSAEKRADLIDYTPFNQALTHVSDPRLAWGVWLKNTGNTTNISMRCGSIEFGNYTTRPEIVDATARKIDVQISIASINLTANVEVPIGAYTVKDFVSMISQINSGGVTYSNFTNTVSNLLLNIQGICSANKPIVLNFYFVPIGNLPTAVFNPVNVGYSVLYEALYGALGTVSLTGAQEIGKFILNRTNGVSENVKEAGRELISGFAGLLTISSGSNATVTDLQINLSTQDEF